MVGLKIHAFMVHFPTSTGVALVETDAGEGYLKAIGNAAGETPVRVSPSEASRCPLRCKGEQLR